MNITSSAFENGQEIPEKYTCNGENINPPLQISGVPKEAKSLILIVDDPDAPRGLWTHWIVFNMDPATTLIGENSTPAGLQGNNSSGSAEYQGPCPPSGIHRYFFRVFALDSMLNQREGANRAEIDNAIKDHIIDQGELMGKFASK